MEKIVIIDDDEDVRDVLEAIVMEVTEDIESFANPLEALEYIKNTSDKIAFIISDYNMPKINGIEIYKNIESREIPFALISGFLGELETELKDKSSHLTLIEKPFNAQKLIELITCSLKN